MSTTQRRSPATPDPKASPTTLSPGQWAPHLHEAEVPILSDEESRAAAEKAKAFMDRRGAGEKAKARR